MAGAVPGFMPTVPADPRTRIRTLLGTLDQQLIATTAAAPVRTAFTELVEALALGPEPEMRACPACGGACRANAQRCGSCWKLLPALVATSPAVVAAGAP